MFILNAETIWSGRPQKYPSLFEVVLLAHMTSRVATRSCVLVFIIYIGHSAVSQTFYQYPGRYNGPLGSALAMIFFYDGILS
jgi:hypothetical protein